MRRNAWAWTDAFFVVYKFRTMRVDANSEIHRDYQRKFIAGHAEANVGDEKHLHINCATIHALHASDVSCDA